jgi:SAM-dependent methyltransferase
VLHENRRRAVSFGDDAERYDRARPRYPDALYELLLAEPAPRVLDVGCGTGIAARELQARGCSVLGVEPDARMARFGQDHGLDVEVAAFEDWEPGARRFDLLVSAQAWHWVEPLRGGACAVHALVPGGRAAMFWNIGAPDGAVGEALQAVYRRLEPQLVDTTVLMGHPAERLDNARRSLTTGGLFGELQEHALTWERVYPTALWCEHLSTHSDYLTMPEPRRAALMNAVAEAIDAHGGSMTITYTTRVVSARRLG